MSRPVSPTKIETIHKYDTEYSADSVEWCPHAPHQHYFVCANYQIRENEDSTPCIRLGRILLFSHQQTELILHQTIETAAVLDQKWCHNQLNNTSILGVVNAQKTLQIYRFNVEFVRLELLTSHEVQNTELLLSLDWSTGKQPSQEPQITVSDSSGHVHVFQFANERISIIEKWKAHDYEAWIAGFYYWNPFVLFSGGDDSVFCQFDTRLDCIQPLIKNRSHEAGVTAFHSSKSREFSVATGSYDSFVRFWDIRHLKHAESSIKMADTLWRVKFDPFRQDFLLAACMRGGVHAIDCKIAPSVVASYYEHENIAYGADWCHSRQGVIASCSFYDHLLCVSQWDLPF